MHPLLGRGLFAAALAWLLDDRDSKMPAVQKQLDHFHAKIKLDEDDEKASLREKRDTLLRTLLKNLPDDVTTFEHFHQGSYSMHTGVLPLDGNYDIDVGLVFDCKRDTYPDPVELKKKVRDALNSNGRTVNIRRPCVTVNYMRDGKPEYHVDLAIYAKRDDGLLDLAKGKEHSEAAHRIWEVSDPKRLTELICTRFKDTDLAQVPPMHPLQQALARHAVPQWRAVEHRADRCGLPLVPAEPDHEWNLHRPAGDARLDRCDARTVPVGHDRRVLPRSPDSRVAWHAERRPDGLDDPAVEERNRCDRRTNILRLERRAAADSNLPSERITPARRGEMPANQH
jgi:hypothetical protein